MVLCVVEQDLVIYLPIPHMKAYICQSQPPSRSILHPGGWRMEDPPLHLSQSATTSLFSMSMILFIFHRQVHLCHILDCTWK